MDKAISPFRNQYHTQLAGRLVLNMPGKKDCLELALPVHILGLLVCYAAIYSL